MKTLKKVSAEQANQLVGGPWNDSDATCWAEYGDFTGLLQSLNKELEKHGLELLEIDAGLSDMPVLLNKIGGR